VRTCPACKGSKYAVPPREGSVFCWCLICKGSGIIPDSLQTLDERLAKLEELIAGFTGDVQEQHYQMKQRIERLERAFVQFAETPLAGFSRDFLTALKAIRQDLAEMDRQRQPKETP